jgi:integrase
MRGSIIAPSGKRKSWSAMIYTGRDEDGRKTHKRVSAPTKPEVEKKVRAVLYQIDCGTLSTAKGTVSDFIQRWFRDYAKSKLAERTVIGYRSIFESGIKPAFGDTQLRNLKYYSDKLAGGASNTTVTHHAMFLHRVLEDAVKWQLLPRNPCDAASPPGIRHVEMHTLDAEQVDVLLDAAKETPYFPEFHLALWTGMRRSENMANRWQDVDLIGAEISISRSMHQLNNPRRIIFRGTKTAKSSRMIGLDPETCDVLRHHLENEMALCSRLGVRFTNDRLLFCEWDGTPISPDRVSRAWDRLIKKLGYGHVRFHDARHTCATLLLKAGVHPKVVQQMLGHATYSTTMDIYSHVTPGMQHSAAESLGQAIRTARENRATRNVGATTGATTNDGPTSQGRPVGLV